MNSLETSAISSFLQEMENSISSEMNIFDSKLSAEEEESVKKEVKVKIAPLRIQRGAIKRRLTLLIKHLIEIVNSDDGHSLIPSILEDINRKLEEVHKFDEEIVAVISASEILQRKPSLLDEELINSTHFHLQYQKTLILFDPKSKSCSHHSSIHESQPLAESNPQQAEIHSLMKTIKQEVRIPPLKCKNFSGEADRLQFRSFLLSFENIIGCRRDLTDASKLIYLKSHLSGMAQKDVEHLPNIDSNYAVALDLLKELYLDVPFIIDSLFNQIYSAPSVDGKNLDAVRNFMSEVRGHLHELKEFGVDLLEEESAGCKLLSHILVSKLPNNFLREFKIRHHEEYPSANIIFGHYHTILKSMERMKASKPHTTFSENSSKRSVSSPSKKKKNFFQSSHFSSQQKSTSPKSDSKISTTFTSIKCKLCEAAHSMSACSKYINPSARRERCIQIGLCASCSSSKHETSFCPAKKYGLSYSCAICKSKAHISALCSSGIKVNQKGSRNTVKSTIPPSAVTSTEEEDSTIQNHLCINTGSAPSENILPTISLDVKLGDKIIKIRCMIDCGSQQTYCRSSVLDRLGIDISSLPHHITNIKTFLGQQSRTMHPVNLEMKLCCNSYHKISVLVDPELNIGFEVKGLMGAEFNIRQNGFNIADRFYYGGIHQDVVDNIDCLLGNDSLYLMKHFKVVNCINGSAIESCLGFIPFGPIRSFLTPSQIKTIFKNKDVKRQEEGSS